MGVWAFTRERLSFLADCRDGRLEWQRAEKVEFVLVAHGLDTPVHDFEDLGGGLVTGVYAAVRTDEGSHVFDDAEDGRVGLEAEVDFFLDVVDGDHLRGGDDDCAVLLAELEVLRDGDVLVGGAGRRCVSECYCR